MDNIRQKVDAILSITELLQGIFKPKDYGRVVLPMTILRRFDCENSTIQEAITRISSQTITNESKYELNEILNDPTNIADNLRKYTTNLSRTASYIMRFFDFEKQIHKLELNDLVYPVVERFSTINLHFDEVTNVEMGYIFEELAQHFSAGEELEDYTWNEVTRLIVNLLFLDDEDITFEHHTYRIKSRLAEEIRQFEERILGKLIKVIEMR